MADEEAAEIPPEPVPPLSEEDLENRQACYDEVFAEFPALEVKQKSMAERKEKEAAPPAEEGEEGVEQAPETTPNIALAYSELDFPTVNKLLNLIKEKSGPLYPSKGQFLDFGSGAGKVCVAAALAHPFEKVVGVEVLQSMNDVANAAVAKYTEAALPEGVVKPEIQFIKGDFVAEFEPLEAIAAEVAVCIVVATTFGEPELQAMAKLAQKMPEGSSLVTVTQTLPEEMVVDVNRDPRKRRAAATKKALAKRGVEPVGIEIVPQPAENDPNGWRLKHTENLELEWGTTPCYIYKKYTYPFCDPGDICMVTPPPEENDTMAYPAYFVSPTTATYMDDGTETPCEISKVVPFTEEDKKNAVKLYEQKLAICKAGEMADSKAVVAAAFNHVKENMGGSLGEDGKISYANDEAKEGMLLVHTMIGNFGAMWDESKVLQFMATKWKDQCKEVDVDASGTISEEEAVGVWENVKTAMGMLIMSKLDQLKA